MAEYLESFPVCRCPLEKIFPLLTAETEVPYFLGQLCYSGAEIFGRDVLKGKNACGQ